MKIAIDCRMLTKSGIGVYLENILEYLLDSSRYSFLLIGEKKHLSKYENRNNCEYLYTNTGIFTISELLFMNTKRINECTIYYSPNFNFPMGLKIPILLSIHDLVFLEVPRFTSPLGRYIRLLYVKRAVKQADVIFTVSNFSKERIISLLAAKQKIYVTYNGINRALLNYDSTCVKPRFNFDYFLYVGNIKPHKGLSMLLDAYSLVRRSGDLRKLVIVGDYKSFKTRDKVVLRRISNNPDIIFTGRVTNEELYTIMRGASMLIQPSLYEGFGIPPLESLFLGTPVVLSNIPVFKELYANLDVCFYDLESTHQLAEYMLNGVEKKSSNFILPVQFDYRYAANVILKIINSYESFTTW